MKSSVLPLASSEFQTSIAFSMPTVIDPPFLGVPVLMVLRPAVDLLTGVDDLAALLQAVAARARAPTAAMPAAKRRFPYPDMSMSISSHALAGLVDRTTARQCPRRDARSAGWCCLGQGRALARVITHSELVESHCAWLNL